VPYPVAMPATVFMNTGGLASTNCFVVADEEAKQAVLFDAPDHTTGPLLDEVQRRGLDLVGLWLTHAHFDHIADHAEVTRRFPGAKVLLHRNDEPRLVQPRGEMFPLPLDIPGRKPDGYLEDGQGLSLGSLRCEVIYTPGHNAGHVSFHFPEEKLLVGGDLIIAGAVGRTDFSDSSHTALFNSIRRVMQLPPDTRLLPGHGDVGTLADELETNPYVRAAMGLGSEGGMDE
jgi:hydroxyacylglutathione hydrolase